jgi:hypothetical protein
LLLQFLFEKEEKRFFLQRNRSLLINFKKRKKETRTVKKMKEEIGKEKNLHLLSVIVVTFLMSFRPSFLFFSNSAHKFFLLKKRLAKYTTKGKMGIKD